MDSSPMGAFGERLHGRDRSKQKSRSGSHRHETNTKTNYENNEYIYLMGYITSSFLPFFSVDEVQDNTTLL